MRFSTVHWGYISGKYFLSSKLEMKGFSRAEFRSKQIAIVDSLVLRMKVNPVTTVEFVMISFCKFTPSSSMPIVRDPLAVLSRVVLS